MILGRRQSPVSVVVVGRGCTGSDRASNAILAQNVWPVWAGGSEQVVWML